MILDRDFISEVWGTILKQKWRSLMTAFGIFWGIFMLVLLIGAGIGLKNGLRASYMAIPANSVIMYSNPTVLPYAGFEPGRIWCITLDDIARLRASNEDKIRDVAMLNKARYTSLTPVKYGNVTVDLDLAGEDPNALKGLPQKVVDGRFINEIDMKMHRNVCIVGVHAAELIFENENPLGKEIQIDGKTYTVVGLGTDTSDKLDFGFRFDEGIVIPLTTMQLGYNQGDDVHTLNFILSDDVDPVPVAAEFEDLIRKWHSLHPDDTSTLQTIIARPLMADMMTVFAGVDLLIWIVGLGTLLAGLIGISNIMLISVKERTREIGIRTAVGAQPLAIIAQIMSESLLLTLSSGIAGLCLGVTLLSLVNRIIGESASSFVHPYMPFWAGMLSLLILVAGGLLAGLIPVRKALNIELVNALSKE